MEKIIPAGAEVLIFRDERKYGKQVNQLEFVRGTVVGSKQSDDLSIHGSPWYVQIYTILGEDGKKYSGTYGSAIVGELFIRTVDDHIEHLKLSISSNSKQIEILKKENELMYQKINDLLYINTNTQDTQNFEFLAEGFKNQDISTQGSEQVAQMAETFRNNNLVNVGPVRKRTRKTDEK